MSGKEVFDKLHRYYYDEVIDEISKEDADVPTLLELYDAKMQGVTMALYTAGLINSREFKEADLLCLDDKLKIRVEKKKE